MAIMVLNLIWPIGIKLSTDAVVMYNTTFASYVVAVGIKIKARREKFFPPPRLQLESTGKAYNLVNAFPSEERIYKTEILSCEFMLFTSNEKEVEKYLPETEKVRIFIGRHHSKIFTIQRSICIC
jgi:hypothetical protein